MKIKKIPLLKISAIALVLYNSISLSHAVQVHADTKLASVGFRPEIKNAIVTVENNDITDPSTIIYIGKKLSFKNLTMSDSDRDPILSDPECKISILDKLGVVSDVIELTKCSNFSIGDSTIPFQILPEYADHYFEISLFANIDMKETNTLGYQPNPARSLEYRITSANPISIDNNIDNTISTLTVDKKWVTADDRQGILVTFNAKNSLGMPINGLALKFSTLLENTTLSAVTDNNDGSYTVYVSGTKAGIGNIQVSLDDKVVHETPNAYEVIHGEWDEDQPYYTDPDRGLFTLPNNPYICKRIHDKKYIPVTVDMNINPKDKHGNPLSRFEFYVSRSTLSNKRANGSISTSWSSRSGYSNGGFSARFVEYTSSDYNYDIHATMAECEASVRDNPIVDVEYTFRLDTIRLLNNSEVGEQPKVNKMNTKLVKEFGKPARIIKL
ncbi:Ig-like domain-containing protein [Plesiomonas shigelloides]|nr:Ig-like domain-containing protein [Plesiomonas shigelloides]